MEKYIKLSEALDILKVMPTDLQYEYISELDGFYMDEEDEPKRGEWKRRIVDNGFNADWVCSECGYRVKTDFVDYNFCPNCGADMRKGADDD